MVILEGKELFLWMLFLIRLNTLAVHQQPQMVPDTRGTVLEPVGENGQEKLVELSLINAMDISI